MMPAPRPRSQPLCLESRSSTPNVKNTRLVFPIAISRTGFFFSVHLDRNLGRFQAHIKILEIRQVFKIHTVLFVIGSKVRVGWCRQCLTSRVKPSHTSCLSCPRQYWGRQEGIVPPHYLHSLPTQTQQLDPIATYTSVHSRLVCMPWVWTIVCLLTGCPGPILHMFLGSQVCGQ